MSAFADDYGPWAVVAGGSDGVGAAFAEGLAERGVNLVLLARRQTALDDVAAGIAERTGVQTRTLAVDLAADDAAAQIVAATADVSVGFLVYCAGADPDFQPFLDNSVDAAIAMVQRNCVTLMRLCHHYAAGMAQRGRGGIVIFGSGAGLAGGPNMVAYSATKAFDMVFAEALWAELNPAGVDVVGLILGKTNTPALRRLEYSRGQIGAQDETPAGAVEVSAVVAEAFASLKAGPTVFVGEDMRAAAQMLGSVSRNQAVSLLAAAINESMGSTE